MQKQNTKQWPKIFTCKFLVPGLVSYKDVDAGIALLKKEAIDGGLSSFPGKPVCIDHYEITPSNYEKYRKGNVVKAYYNPTDGWFYADFIVDDDEAIDCIENKGYSVSCAYNVLECGDGGLYQDLPYDGEITKISFTHLALVTQPRYEESAILEQMPLMLVNGKIKAHNISNQEEQKMFKLFQKNKEGEQKEVSAFVLVNGKQVSMEDLLTAYNEKGEMDKKELYQAKDDDIVDIAGKKVSIGEMKNAYVKMNEKAADDEKSAKDKVKEEGVEDKKKNEKKDEQEKDAEGEKDKKDKPEGAEEEEAKRSKENSKKDPEGKEFFLQLQEAENSKDIAQEDQSASGRFGLTRTERANGWKDRISKNIAAR